MDEEAQQAQPTVVEAQPATTVAVDQGFTYDLPNLDGGTQTLQFIRKEEKDGTLVTMINGVTTEVVIDACIQRLKFLNGQLPDGFTIEAIRHLEAGLLALQNRTAERERQGVEGTNKPIVEEAAINLSREKGDVTPDRNVT